MAKSAKPQSQPINPNKVMVELLLRTEGPGIMMAPATHNPNFTFEITVPPGVKITKINIDGHKIEGQRLAQMSMLSTNGILKGGEFIFLAIDKIFLIVEAVGMPGRKVKIALKFQNQAVQLNPSEFTIGENGRGILVVENIQLP